MKAAELLVNALEAEGVEYVFGLPGEENLEFLEALLQVRVTIAEARYSKRLHCFCKRK